MKNLSLVGVVSIIRENKIDKFLDAIESFRSLCTSSTPIAPTIRMLEKATDPR